MAKTVINLSDPVSTLVTKTNAISDDVGDVALLTTGDSNVVDAINTVRNIVVPFDDSSEIRDIARSAFLVVDSGGGGMSLSFDSSVGRINLQSNLIGGAGIDYDSYAGTFSITDLGITTAMIANTNVTNGKIADNTLLSAKFNSVVTLRILDSDGTTLKTLFSPGS